mgnify:CR=1 FL=1
MAYFNPRTPVGCDNPTGLHQPLRSDFNPRTPVGCDAQWSFGRRLQMLFQSTHPSGVRRPSTRRASPTRHFNPRTPVGCDVPVLVLACIGDRISIHAPQWGATSAYHQSPAGALFQSTHPSGVRPTDSAAIVRCKQFQSTHPSGVRPPSGDCGRSATADFNPRTPVGCDYIFNDLRDTPLISIHAPQWGATRTV